MGKQKIVTKVQMEDAKKRAKALKVAVGLQGVISAAVDGEKIVVVGDGIDSVELMTLLRKKMGYAELLSVAGADEKKDEKEDGKKDEKKEGVQVQQTIFPYPPQYHVYEARDTYYNNDPCRIM